jgi:hypothetical protein
MARGLSQQPNATSSLASSDEKNAMVDEIWKLLCTIRSTCSISKGEVWESPKSRSSYIQGSRKHNKYDGVQIIKTKESKSLLSSLPNLSSVYIKINENSGLSAPTCPHHMVLCHRLNIWIPEIPQNSLSECLGIWQGHTKRLHHWAQAESRCLPYTRRH